MGRVTFGVQRVRDRRWASMLYGVSGRTEHDSDVVARVGGPRSRSHCPSSIVSESGPVSLAGEWEMRALIAIATTTIRSSIRSHVVHVVLFFLIFTVFVLPLTIAGDGTARGLLQIAMNYTLGFVGVLLSFVTLWLGCTVMADDIETYQIHMLFSKPVPRSVVWLGKWLGIIVLQGTLLLVSGMFIYVLVIWKIHASDFPDDEMLRLRDEVLVGRRRFDPDMFDIEKEVRRRVLIRTRNPIAPSLSQKIIEDQIRRRVRVQAGEVPFRERKHWVFRGLTAMTTDDPIFFRFRMYVDRVAKRDQPATAGRWWVLNPEDTRMYPRRAPPFQAGVFHEFRIPPRFVSKSGQLVIAYENLDRERKSVILQLVDGPLLLIPEAGFLNNYARVIGLLFLQLVFLAAIACAAGGAFSIPVAIFVAFSYVLIGAVVIAIRPESIDDLVIPRMFIGRLLLNVRQFADLIVVSVNEFNEISKLTKGELVRLQDIGAIFLSVCVLRGLPIAVLGIWLLKRKEVGLVIRR